MISISLFSNQFLHIITLPRRMDAPEPAQQQVFSSELGRNYVIDGEEFFYQIDGFESSIGFVMGIDKFTIIGRRLSFDVPVFKGDDDIEADVILLVSSSLGQLELFYVVHDLLCSNQLRQLQNLIDWIVANQEWSFSEDLQQVGLYHSCEDHSCRPAVDSVIVLGVGEVQLGGFVVERCDFGIVFLGGEVVLAQSEVDDFQFLSLVVDEDVEGFDVSVHDAVGMDVVESLNHQEEYLEQFFHVQLDVLKSEFGIDFSEILMLKVLQNVAGGSQVRALDNIQNFDDVWMVDLLEDLVLPLDLAGFDGQQHLDRNLLFGFYIPSLENVGILSATYLVRNGIVLQFAALLTPYPQGSSIASQRISFISSRLRFTELKGCTEVYFFSIQNSKIISLENQNESQYPSGIEGRTCFVNSSLNQENIQSD